MSFLTKVLGRPKKHDKKSASSSLSEAIKGLKETQEDLTKKQLSLEASIKKELALAKKYANKDKKAALLALGRKKKYGQQLQKIDNTLTQLEHQLALLEEANVNNLALNSMKQASNAMKNTQKVSNVDEIAAIFDDLAEEKESLEAIAEAFGNNIGEQFDEEELERELELLEIGGENVVVLLPEVPTDEMHNQNDAKRKSSEGGKATPAHA